VTGWPGERALNGGADHIPIEQLHRSVGGLWLCSKHFVGPDPDEALARTGTTTVVCLCERSELASRYPDYVAWLHDNRSISALWMPIADLDAPSRQEGKAMVAELHHQLESGQRLLMHCGAGLGRAGTMAIAVLVSLGTDPREAAALVAARRPMAGPQSAEQSEFLAAVASGSGLP
jgi:protein-tyrosine phosphatase